MSTTNHGIIWGRSLETLGYVFLQKVLDNMDAESSVRLGQTGTGVRPNYQVTNASGEVSVFRGSGDIHETFQDVDKFNRDNISIAFSYEEVSVAMKNAEKLNQAEPVEK